MILLVMPWSLQIFLKEMYDSDRAWMNSSSHVSLCVYLISSILAIQKQSIRYFEEEQSSFEQNGRIFINFLLMSFKPFQSAYFTFYKINRTALSLYSPSQISISALFLRYEKPEFFLILTISLLASSMIREHISSSDSVALRSCFWSEIDFTVMLRMLLPYYHSTTLRMMVQLRKMISRMRIILSLRSRDSPFCYRVGMTLMSTCRPVTLHGNRLSRQLEKLMHSQSFQSRGLPQLRSLAYPKIPWMRQMTLKKSQVLLPICRLAYFCTIRLQTISKERSRLSTMLFQTMRSKAMSWFILRIYSVIHSCSAPIVSPLRSQDLTSRMGRQMYQTGPPLFFSSFCISFSGISKRMMKLGRCGVRILQICQKQRFSLDTAQPYRQTISFLSFSTQSSNLSKDQTVQRMQVFQSGRYLQSCWMSSMEDQRGSCCTICGSSLKRLSLMIGLGEKTTLERMVSSLMTGSTVLMYFRQPGSVISRLDSGMSSSGSSTRKSLKVLLMLQLKISGMWKDRRDLYYQYCSRERRFTSCSFYWSSSAQLRQKNCSQLRISTTNSCTFCRRVKWRLTLGVSTYCLRGRKDSSFFSRFKCCMRFTSNSATTALLVLSSVICQKQSTLLALLNSSAKMNERGSLLACTLLAAKMVLKSWMSSASWTGLSWKRFFLSALSMKSMQELNSQKWQLQQSVHSDSYFRFSASNQGSETSLSSLRFWMMFRQELSISCTILPFMRLTFDCCCTDCANFSSCVLSALKFLKESVSSRLILSGFPATTFTLPSMSTNLEMQLVQTVEYSSALAQTMQVMWLRLALANSKVMPMAEVVMLKGGMRSLGANFPRSFLTPSSQEQMVMALQPIFFLPKFTCRLLISYLRFRIHSTLFRCALNSSFMLLREVVQNSISGFPKHLRQPLAQSRQGLKSPPKSIILAQRLYNSYSFPPTVFAKISLVLTMTAAKRTAFCGLQASLGKFSKMLVTSDRNSLLDLPIELSSCTRQVSSPMISSLCDSVPA